MGTLFSCIPTAFQQWEWHSPGTSSQLLYKTVRSFLNLVRKWYRGNVMFTIVNAACRSRLSVTVCLRSKGCYRNLCNGRTANCTAPLQRTDKRLVTNSLKSAADSFSVQFFLDHLFAALILLMVMYFVSILHTYIVNFVCVACTMLRLIYISVFMCVICIMLSMFATFHINNSYYLLLGWCTMFLIVQECSNRCWISEVQLFCPVCLQKCWHMDCGRGAQLPDLLEVTVCLSAEFIALFETEWVLLVIQA